VLGSFDLPGCVDVDSSCTKDPLPENTHWFIVRCQDALGMTIHRFSSFQSVQHAN
jgi:hypothetical protein